MSDSLITKKAIADAVKQLCREKPFAKISIGDITAACRLNRQTFYYHFQDKYELLSWIFYNDIFAVILEEISFDNWDEKMRQMLEIMKSEKSFYISTVKEEEHTFEAYLFEMMKNLFLEAIDRLDQSRAVTQKEKEFDAEFFAYGICGVVISWAERGMRTEPAVLARQLKELASRTEQVGEVKRKL